jgi:hypothetical protein|tara:strand:+ start:528 stop:1268 length:741 start_codon:yes stop_codon:yes gene_type:complete
MAENKFPSEVVDLPSGGKIYGKDSPLYDGKIELKYMTAREEDILTSANLIKKGVVITKLLDSLIVTEGVSTDDLVLGDKNGVMVAARILAYGSSYETEITDPESGQKISYTFDLTECPFKAVPETTESNNFEFELPISKQKITFKILTGKDERAIELELKRLTKHTGDSTEVTTRLRYMIQSVDGDSATGTINNFSLNMLARDSLALREEVLRISPDIDMSTEVELGGEMVAVTIPMTANFFWPKS